MELDPSWEALFDPHLKQPYFEELRAFLRSESTVDAIYPPLAQVFRAFEWTPAHAVRAVILGQDPYHQPGQAHGLSFSVPDGVAPPPSLRNIFVERSRDLELPPPPHGCLKKWAEGGVLLLNRTLSVRRGAPLSHAHRGWEMFTDAALRFLWALPQPLVFLLWGANARAAVEPLRPTSAPAPRLVLTAPHPSPLSAYRGFIGCGHFSKANAFLQEHDQRPIDWRLEGEEALDGTKGTIEAL